MSLTLDREEGSIGPCK